MSISPTELTRKFADEYYYILVNQKKLMRNPRRPIWSISKQYYCYALASLFVLSLSAFLTLSDFGFLPVLVFTSFTFILVVFVTIKVLKAISGITNADPKKYRLNLTAKHASYDMPGGTLVMTWDEIRTIIMTKNSIVFLPKTSANVPISLPISCEKEVRASLKKLKHSDLIA